MSKRAEWQGLVVDYDVAAGSGLGLYISLDGQRTRVDLNYVGEVACGGYTALKSNRAKVLTRLTELAPNRTTYKFDENGNIYVEAPTYTSGGGSGGGGGGFCCHSRWC